MVYFLSDAHLGSRAVEDFAGHQQRLVDLLRTMSADATAIYLLGDMFDFWYEYAWRDASKEQYRPFLDTLRRLTDSGVKVHYFIGNHDIWTFGWLARETGVTVHRGPLTQTVCGKVVYMAHGDGIVPAHYLQTFPKPIRKKIRRFMRLRALFHHPIPQALFRLVPPAWGNSFGYEWARKSRLKELAHPCPYKGENAEELVLYAKEQEQQGNHHDYYIFGHRHIELDLQIARDSRVVILGDCWRLWTYARMDEKGNIILCTQEQNN